MKDSKRNFPPNYLTGAYEAADAGLKARECEKSMRYFIISYAYVRDFGKVFGFGSGSSVGPNYPNQKDLEKDYSMGGQQHVSIIAIQELTESDYNDWIKTEEE